MNSTTRGPAFHLHAERLFAAAGQHTANDLSGLTPAAGQGSESAQADWRQWASVPCIAVLADPNMGKSREFRHQVDLARESGEAAYYTEWLQWYEGANLLELVDDPAGFMQALSDGRTVTWYFDGLDEGRLRTSSALQHLVGALRKLRQQALPGSVSLRLSCRAAEWRATDHELLRQFFDTPGSDESNVTVLRLLPLTDAAVRLLAAEKLTSPARVDAFMAAMRARNVTALAGHPLLLALMLHQFQPSGQLGANRTAIYADAIEGLIRETNPSRANGVVPSTSLVQRRLVVKDIAARLVLGGYAKLGSSEAVQDAVMLDTEELHGTPADVKAALESGIFVRHDDGTFSPFHRSFAEYLAAERLATGLKADWTLNSVLPLFPVEQGGIPSPLRETAAWLASLSAPFRGWLITHDPLTACLGDTARYEPEDRVALVKVLVDRYRDRQWQNEFDRFGDLAQTLTESDLRQLLGRANGQAVQLMGIQMIESANRPELLPPLLETALDDLESAPVRARAITALGALDPGSFAVQLKPLLSGPRSLDAHDEIAGAVLNSLYPDHLSTQEALSALREPGDRGVYGLFRLFWGRNFLASLPATAEDRRQAIAGLGQWFRTLLSDASKVESDLDRIQRLTMSPRSTFETFVSLVHRELLSPDHVIDDLAPHLLLIDEWGKKYGDAQANQGPVKLIATDMTLRGKLLDWWMRAPKPARSFICHLPYIGGSSVAGDFALFSAACDTYQDDADASVDAFGELVRVAYRFPAPGQLERITELAQREQQFAQLWEDAAICKLEGPVAESRRFAQEAEARRREAKDERTREVRQSLDALRQGNVGQLLRLAFERTFDLRVDSSEAVLRDVQEQYGEQVLDAFREGLLLVWNKLDNGERLWPVHPPHPHRGTSLSNEAMVASLGFQLARAPQDDLSDLTDPQVECVLWLARFCDGEWRPTFLRAWHARPELVARRIERLLDQEATAPESAHPSLWNMLAAVDDLPDPLREQLAAYAEAHPVPEHAGVRRALYTMLWRHREAMETSRRIRPALVAHARSVLGGVPSDQGQEARGMAALALAWLLEPEPVEGIAAEAFTGERRRARALGFLSTLTHTLSPSTPVLGAWPDDISDEAYADLVPHLMFEEPYGTERDDEPGLDAGAQMVIDSRNRLVSRLATSGHRDAEAWFAAWRTDPRFGGFRDWIASLHASIQRQAMDDQWSPLTRVQRDAVLLRKGTLVRNLDDIRTWLEDLMEQKVAPTFLTDYSLTPLLWEKADPVHKHLDEKKLQTALYHAIHTQVLHMPMVGAREPEQYQAKKPDGRLSFVLEDGRVVDVPIEVKWSDNDSLWDAPRTQLLGKYMVDPSIRHGLYVVGWAGVKHVKNGPNGRPATPEDLRRELQLVADAAVESTDKTIKVHVIDVSRPE